MLLAYCVTRFQYCFLSSSIGVKIQPKNKGKE